MAKGKGAQCPHCGAFTFHDKGPLRECTRCGYIGWSWLQPVAPVGKGKGNKCPNCSKQTLHRVTPVSRRLVIRRCATCNFSAIEP